MWWNKLIIVVTRVCFLLNAFKTLKRRKKTKTKILMTMHQSELNGNSLISHFPFVSLLLFYSLACLLLQCPHMMIYNVENINDKFFIEKKCKSINHDSKNGNL